MLFDIDPWGRYLCSGTQNGRVLLYDTQTFKLVCELDNYFDNGGGSGNKSSGSSSGDGVGSDSGSIVGVENRRLYERKQSSCVHTVLFHPYYSILSSVCGERAFASFENSDDESEQGIDTATIYSSNSHSRKRSIQEQPVPRLADERGRNVCFWSLHKNQIYYTG